MQSTPLTSEEKVQIMTTAILAIQMNTPKRKLTTKDLKKMIEEDSNANKKKVDAQVPKNGSHCYQPSFAKSNLILCQPSQRPHTEHRVPNQKEVCPNKRARF